MTDRSTSRLTVADGTGHEFTLVLRANGMDGIELVAVSKYAATNTTLSFEAAEMLFTQGLEVIKAYRKARRLEVSSG